MKTIWCILFLAVSVDAATYSVQAGGGGNYTTIQACATAMSAGDTCTVYAGTYNENVTVTAGTAGNYKTINVNGSDVVNVLSFTLNSHTKIIGFHVQNPSSPKSYACAAIAAGATDIYITNNVMSQCGGGSTGDSIIWMDNTSGASYVYIQGNTLSYAYGTPAAPDNSVPIYTFGHHMLIENNDISHVLFGVDIASSYTVFRNNTIHDMYQSECTALHVSFCHMDMIYSEPGATFPSPYNLCEGNIGRTNVGSDSKGTFAQGDGCGAGGCHNLIIRFNVLAHLGSGVMAGLSDFKYVKMYNNTIVDPDTFYIGVMYQTGNNHFLNSPNGAEINNLFYFPEAIPQSLGWQAYNVSSDSAAGFTAGSNLAWCTGTPCYLYDRNDTGTFTSDAPGNQLADPKFVNYAGNDFRLASGSPAIGAGTHLTSVAAGDSGSGTSLVVNDASFFQDGYGLAGVRADCVSVTAAGNHVCVTAVNYQTNTLTLASSITRSAGDAVWLYSDSTGRQVLLGSAPNIGATFGPQSSAAPPTGLTAAVH